ncbi:hypothetical protein FRC07_014639 [Ceratobasidium sp. 392]|nr:hypothetical protein FRC07_014639 [Ceratobasidium sp. 392]
MISFEGAGKRIDVIDPKRHSLSENGAYIGVASLEERKALLLKAIAADEEALRAMTLLGERLLNDAVPVGSHVTDAGADGSLESTIEGFRRMSTAGA